jgi:hypothetical protein
MLEITPIDTVAADVMWLAGRLEGLLEVRCWVELSMAGEEPAKGQRSALE